MMYPKEKKVYQKAVEEADFGYEYPDDLPLHPKTDLHKRIVQEVVKRARAGKRFVDTSNAREIWERMDHNLTAYVPLDSEEKRIKTGDYRKPVRVVIPMLFASLETMLTYLSGMFLRTPICRLKGVGSKQALINTAKMERVLEAQNNWFKLGAKLNTMWRDGLVYGVGLASPVWRKKKAVLPRNERVDESIVAAAAKDFPDLSVGDIMRFAEEKVLFEGNELDNVDINNAFLDPYTPTTDIQKAEYIGYMKRSNVMSLLRQEEDPESGLFNVRYARMRATKGGSLRDWWIDHEHGGRGEKMGTATEQQIDHGAHENAADVIVMYCDLIPSEWGLNDSDYPERWMFSVLGDIVIQADQLQFWHGQVPMLSYTPNNTGYDVLPTSYLATAYGLQETIDFLVSSHTANVRKAVNDMIVFDPSMVEEEDILNPEPGKLIRLKSPSYGGASIDAYVKQLQVHDVTQSHLVNAGAFIDLINRVLGTEDIVLGDMSNMPERPTARGIQAAQSGALSRLQRIALLTSTQLMSDLTMQMAFNTMQFMQHPVGISVMGRYEQELRREYGLPAGDNEAVVEPWDLEPHFEVEVHDGAQPAMDDINAMTEVMKTAMAVEGVAMQVYGGLNIPGMFLQWARKAGFEDVHQFVQQTGGGVAPQVMPDQQVEQQVQAGNMVPMEEAMAL
jgi:hypothetical protein